MVRTVTIPVDGAALLVREIGRGMPIIIVHGGPGVFDHSYLLPDMDRLASDHRLIYYDQRCHGGSSGDVADAERLDVDTHLRDLDAVRAHAGLDRFALLGHSWGGHLAMRYAGRHPQRVSHLILMNSGPATKEDYDDFLRYRRSLAAPVAAQLESLRSDPGFDTAEPTVVAAATRLSLGVGIRRVEDVARLELNLTTDNIVRGRAVSRRFNQLIFDQEFDLGPQLASLRVPTLVLHGEYDFVPVAAAERIAQSIPGARLVVLPECGHFAYLEAPDAVAGEIAALLDG